MLRKMRILSGSWSSQLSPDDTVRLEVYDKNSIEKHLS